MKLTVNGEATEVTADAERSLLSVLRHELELTGAKYGCGEGNCGACTVMIDGEPVRSCITPFASASGREVITVEGLADGETLHPVQQAFADRSAFQCGYCTPGFVVSSVALLNRRPSPTNDEIKGALNGHICRCGAYVRILQAVKDASVAVAKGDSQ